MHVADRLVNTVTPPRLQARVPAFLKVYALLLLLPRCHHYVATVVGCDELPGHGHVTLYFRSHSTCQHMDIV
jgi:hypothetical protein